MSTPDYGARIIADSLAPCGKRLTTLVLRLPRFILAEQNTHRAFSRNAASSRAIPVEKMIQRIIEEPALPVFWGKNQPGMQADEQLTGTELDLARELWLSARNGAITYARSLIQIGLHKQIANRLLEPWMIAEVIVSATEWDNFFRQRLDKHAQPEFRVVAEAIRDAMGASTPQELKAGEWHLPYIDDATQSEVAEHVGVGAAYFSRNADQQHQALDALYLRLCLVSAARCARVSYFTHDGKKEWQVDLDLAKRLIGPGHWSPFEHIAQALDRPYRRANFVGFEQFRALVDTDNFPATAQRNLGI